MDPGYIDLVVSNRRHQDVDGPGGRTPNGTWDVGATTNWTAGSGPTTYDDVTVTTRSLFDDSAVAPGTTAVTLNTTVSPTDITFNNSSLAYSVSGSGAIAGMGGMAIKGGGSVTLNNGVTYSYSGATAVSNNSTLVLNGTLANSAVSLSGGNIGGAGDASARRSPPAAPTRWPPAAPCRSRALPRSPAASSPWAAART